MGPNTKILVSFINFIFTVVQLFLGLRILLKLLGANPSTQFVAWVYATSAPLLEPFIGMFPSPLIESNFILEFSTLFALAIYAIVGWLISEIIIFISEFTSRRRISDQIGK